MRPVLLALLCAVLAAPALASPSPDEQLPDPVMEHRARHLYQALRCVVCQSQSIDESNAALAEDMRIVVRQRLASGDSDAEILAYMQHRYGDYVLMLPPLQANTLALWGLPFFILLIGGIGIVVFVRRQARDMPAELSPAEAEEIAAMMREEGQE